jgi:hypothetical protein
MSDIIEKSRTSIKDKIKKDPIPIIGNCLLGNYLRGGIINKLNLNDSNLKV